MLQFSLLWFISKLTSLLFWLAAINYYYFRSDGNYNFQEFLGTTDVMSIVFEVMAANKTQIALIYDPKNTNGEHK